MQPMGASDTCHSVPFPGPLPPLPASLWSLFHVFLQPNLGTRNHLIRAEPWTPEPGPATALLCPTFKYWDRAPSCPHVVSAQLKDG